MIHKQLILVRHGETEANIANSLEYSIVGGRYHSPLTCHGRKQAIELQGQAILKDCNLVLSSPSVRSIETAVLATNLTPEKVVIDNRLDERSLGECEGMKLDTLKKHSVYGHLFNQDENARHLRHSFSNSLPGGEHYGDVVNRTRNCLMQTLEMVPNGGKIAVFSHMVTIRCILHWTLGLSEQETLNLKIKNCSPIVISFSPDGNRLELPERRSLTWE